MARQREGLQKLGPLTGTLSILQLLVAHLMRPEEGSSKRWAWNSFHWLTGRVALCLGIANLFIGVCTDAHLLYLLAWLH
jgi:hypothetical protein